MGKMISGLLTGMVSVVLFKIDVNLGTGFAIALGLSLGVGYWIGYAIFRK
jgi:hypothetical protein